MTVGNIVGYERFNPQNGAMRLIGLLPTRNRYLPPENPANQTVVRANEARTKSYKEWFRGLIHDLIERILEPIQNVAEDGINLRCPDGERRLCFPIIGVYIADYPEMQLVSNIVYQFCPICTIPRHKSLKKDVDETNSEQDEVDETDTLEDEADNIDPRDLRIKELERIVAKSNKGSGSKFKASNQRNLGINRSHGGAISKQKQSKSKSKRQRSQLINDTRSEGEPFLDHPNHPRRTIEEARRLRCLYSDDENALKALGYHRTNPFTE